MKTNWLFPHRYRLIGWIIFIPSALLGLATMYGDFTIKWLSFTINQDENTIKLGHSVMHFSESLNMTDEIAALGVIMGLLLIAFAKEKIEDEMISRLRLEALQWSVYVNYLILAIAILVFYDGAFFSIMIYNMFTILLVFIIRFRWLLHRNTTTLLAI